MGLTQARLAGAIIFSSSLVKAVEPGRVPAGHAFTTTTTTVARALGLEWAGSSVKIKCTVVTGRSATRPPLPDIIASGLDADMHGMAVAMGAQDGTTALTRAREVDATRLPSRPTDRDRNVPGG